MAIEAGTRGPDYVKRACGKHSVIYRSCDCPCTCDFRGVKGMHHSTTCPVFHPEVPRVFLPKEPA